MRRDDDDMVHAKGDSGRIVGNPEAIQNGVVGNLPGRIAGRLGAVIKT
jgi:hypothetical protein